MTLNIPDPVAQLKTRLAALGDGRDAKSDNERDAYHRAYNGTQRVISGLMNVPNDLAKPTGMLADLEARRAVVVLKQAEIEQALSDAPDWREFDDGRARDVEYDRQQHLGRQLQLLIDGELLMAPGITYERVGDLDARIAELQQRIAALRVRHGALLRDAEHALTATVAT